MPLILPGNVGSATASTTYNVANSARFDDGSSDNLKRTYGTPTNAKIFALSWWIKLVKAWDGSGSQDFWGERAGSGTIKWKARKLLAAGKIDEEEFKLKAKKEAEEAEAKREEQRKKNEKAKLNAKKAEEVKQAV